VHQSWTFYKSAEFFTDIALVAAILTCVSDSRQFKILFDWNWTLIAFLLINLWVGLLIWPDAVKTNVGVLNLQISGVYPAIAANEVGDYGAILALVALTRFILVPAKRPFYLSVFFLAGLTLLFSYSRTPMVAFVLAASLPIAFVSRKLIAAGAVAVLTLFPIALATPLKAMIWDFWMPSGHSRAVSMFGASQLT
jgi:hypothetical protein